MGEVPLKMMQSSRQLHIHTPRHSFSSSLSHSLFRSFLSSTVSGKNNAVASWREIMNTFAIEFPSICLRALLDGYRYVVSVCVSSPNHNGSQTPLHCTISPHHCHSSISILLRGWISPLCSSPHSPCDTTRHPLLLLSLFFTLYHLLHLFFVLLLPSRSFAYPFMLLLLISLSSFIYIFTLHFSAPILFLLFLYLSLYLAPSMPFYLTFFFPLLFNIYVLFSLIFLLSLILIPPFFAFVPHLSFILFAFLPFCFPHSSALPTSIHVSPLFS